MSATLRDVARLQAVKPTIRRWISRAFVVAAGIAACRSEGCLCEYCGGIGLLAGNYMEEQREQERLLAECGTCQAGEKCHLLLSPARCRPDPVVAGDPCGEWMNRSYEPASTFTCADGLVCNGALEPDACMAPGGDGTPCQHSGACAPEFFCDRMTACRPTFAKGAKCDDTEQCRPLTCHLAQGYVCAAPSPLGAACIRNEDCESMLCDAKELEQGKCIAR